MCQQVEGNESPHLGIQEKQLKKKKNIIKTGRITVQIFGLFFYPLEEHRHSGG